GPARRPNPCGVRSGERSLSAGTGQCSPPNAVESVNGERRLRLRYRGAHSRLHFLEGASLDLPYTLARDAERRGQLLQCNWLVYKAPPLEDAPLTLVEDSERLGQRLRAVLEFLALSESRFLVGALIDERVLPLARIAVFPDRRVERHVASEPAVH